MLKRIWQFFRRSNRIQPGNDQLLASFPKNELKSFSSWAVIVGIVSAAVLEILRANLQVDLFILLILTVSIKFPHFPANSIRAQTMLSLCTLGTFGWDMFVLIRRINTNSYYTALEVGFIRFFASIVMLSKVVIFYEFLNNVQGANRVRKYLHRRFRLFLFPFQQPKRIMRDVRGRYLALSWLHVVSFSILVTLWAVLVFGLDYNVFFLTSFSSAYLSWFLAGKAFTTLLCIFGLWYDIDPCLCLLHFGCCVFTMPAIRRYIRQRRAVLGGYPLAVSFYPLRFFLWQLLKGVDILVGIGLWVILVLNAGARKEVEAAMYVYLGTLGLVLFVSDIWSMLIVLGIRWLLSRYKMLQKLPVSLRAAIPSAQATYYSDDSELDEFNLRCIVPIQPNLSNKSSRSHKKNQNSSNKKSSSAAHSDTLRTVKENPTSLTALMTIFLFPGKYIQDDGDIMNQSEDNDDNSDSSGSDTQQRLGDDEDADWDEQSKLIARRIEDKVQSTWTTFTKALSQYNKKNNNNSKPDGNKKRRSKSQQKKTRIGIDPLSMSSFIEGMENEAIGNEEEKNDYSDLQDIEIGTLRKKPISNNAYSANNNTSMLQDADSNLVFPDSNNDDTLNTSIVFSEQSFLDGDESVNTTIISSSKKPVDTSFGITTWLSTPLRNKLYQKKGNRILPTLIPDNRENTDIVGWENEDAEDDDNELNTSLQQEDGRLQTTRRRMKINNNSEDEDNESDSDNNVDNTSINTSTRYEEFDVLDQRIDQGEIFHPYIRTKPLEPGGVPGSASKFEGANPMHRRKKRIIVNESDHEDDNDDGSDENEKKIEPEEKDRDDKIVRKGRKDKTATKLANASILQEKIQQRLLCHSEDHFHERWKHWRYLWLSASSMPLRAQRVQFAWPNNMDTVIDNVKNKPRSNSTNDTFSTPPRKPTYFDSKEEEKQSQEDISLRLDALEESLVALLQRHPLRFLTYTNSLSTKQQQETELEKGQKMQSSIQPENNTIIPTTSNKESLRPSTISSSVQISNNIDNSTLAKSKLNLSSRRIFAQTLLRDDSGRLGVWIDDVETIDESDLGASPAVPQKKNTWKSMLLKSMADSTSLNPVSSANAFVQKEKDSKTGKEKGASYVLVLWEFVVASVWSKHHHASSASSHARLDALSNTNTNTAAAAADSRVVHVATDFFVETHLCIDPSFVVEASAEQRLLWQSYEEFLFRSFHWDTLPRYAPSLFARDPKTSYFWTSFRVVAIDYAVMNAKNTTKKTTSKKKNTANSTSSDGKDTRTTSFPSAALARAALFG